MIANSVKELPPNVEPSDLKYEYEDRIAYSEDHPSTLTMHLVDNGWMIATLHISNPSRNQRARGIDTSRTYAIHQISGKIYTVGKGPHVKATLTVYIKKSNIERLRPLLFRYNQGMEAAGKIRDRRSTRIAQGRLRRASSNESWFYL